MKSIFDEDELVKYDSPPDDDPDDDIDWEEDEKEALREQELKKQQQMQNNNFSGGVFQGGSWTPQPQQSPSPWGVQQQSTPSWGSQYSPWGQQQQRPVQQWGTWGNSGNIFGGATTQQQAAQSVPQGNNPYLIPRTKRVVVSDLLDILISSFNSNNVLGIQPRGIYDIYLRRDIIERIRCIGPQYFYILTNMRPMPGTESEAKFMRLLDYVTACVADLLGLPMGNVRCAVKCSIDPSDPDVKPGIGLIQKIMKDNPDIPKTDYLIIGSQSGFQYQPDRDQRFAQNAGIDYIDVQQLLTIYK